MALVVQECSDPVHQHRSCRRGLGSCGGECRRWPGSRRDRVATARAGHIQSLSYSLEATGLGLLDLVNLAKLSGDAVLLSFQQLKWQRVRQMRLQQLLLFRFKLRTPLLSLVEMLACVYALALDLGSKHCAEPPEEVRWRLKPLICLLDLPLDPIDR